MEKVQQTDARGVWGWVGESGKSRFPSPTDNLRWQDKENNIVGVHKLLWSFYLVTLSGVTFKFSATMHLSKPFI